VSAPSWPETISDETREWNRRFANELRDQRWAKRQLVAELRDLMDVGLACNVQTWASYGVKSEVELCRKRRADAKRLLRLAIKAVEDAS
jgi:hypothetical protein